MEILSCLLEIQHRFDSLTPTEKKIARYIAENSAQVLMMPIDELADLTGTGKSAIIRCCKSLGFDGYKALKVSLTMDVTRKDNSDFANFIEADETADSIVNKIFSANIKTLQDTWRHLNVDVLRQAAQVIASADMCYIYGIGSSALIGADFQHRLFQLGYRSVAVTDVTAMKDSSLCIKKGDVAFALSNSGRTIATVEALRQAKENGATTVCITGYASSPIAQISDYVLCTTSDEFKYPAESIASRVARNAVIDALVVTLSTIDYSGSVEKMLRIREMLGDVKYPTAAKK